VRDLREFGRDSLAGTRFQFDVRSAGLLRPTLSVPAYVGHVPQDGIAPIYNYFDRSRGGVYYSQRVSRRQCKDFRGGRLTYDEHDGTDFVCPIGTELVAPAPGIVVMIRHRWLRGGLTVAVDHGGGIVSHATHCARALVEIGQPVVRGETIALSGAAGIDLVQFFPLVPPHIHFMVWRDGVPIDPYRRNDEPDESGTWASRNDPRPMEPISGERPTAEDGAIDRRALDEASAACRDATIRHELVRVSGNALATAALLEDALHHDRWAWPSGYVPPRLRVRAGGRKVRMRLPLGGDYVGAKPGS
jgi:hypothetical protein